jgi:membrane-bound lytic murein transglycosylase MltF
VDPLNRVLFALASYNAGPARIAGLRQRAAARGLNPNVWFENVELVAAESIGQETVNYVRNVYKYYVAYKLSQDHSNHTHIANSDVHDHRQTAAMARRGMVTLSLNARRT